MKNDAFGDRMKMYEATNDIRIGSDFPVVARIDGRSFSKFTRGFQKPFDEAMTNAMAVTMAYLVREMHAKIGYCQSDEITLIFEATENGDLPFGGRVNKLTSVLAGMASSKFALTLPYRNAVAQRVPHFDCRVFAVPSRTEAANALLWRSQDCRKNAVQSVARAHFSHKQLHQKNQQDMLRMLADIGVYMEHYNRFAVWGTYAARRVTPQVIDDETWAKIPDDKKPDSRTVLRTEVWPLPIKYFGDVTNRVGVIFNGEEPVYG